MPRFGKTLMSNAGRRSLPRRGWLDSILSSSPQSPALPQPTDFPKPEIPHRKNVGRHCVCAKIPVCPKNLVQCFRRLVSSVF